VVPGCETLPDDIREERWWTVRACAMCVRLKKRCKWIRKNIKERWEQ
jgi:hypothetical protein